MSFADDARKESGPARGVGDQITGQAAVRRFFSDQGYNAGSDRAGRHGDRLRWAKEGRRDDVPPRRLEQSFALNGR